MYVCLCVCVRVCVCVIANASFTIMILYRLTATDVDGASNYTIVNITVLPAVDNPPIANAGSAKKLLWPHNRLILYGNASFDDNVCVDYHYLFVYLPYINPSGYCFVQMAENGWSYSRHAGELLAHMSLLSAHMIMSLQGSSAAILELNDLQLGDYVFTLTVTDKSDQQSSAEVSVAVVEGNFSTWWVYLCCPHLITINRGQQTTSR